MSKLRTYSPVDNSMVVEREYASKSMIGGTCEAAKKAQQSWQNTPVVERAHFCKKAVEYLYSKKTELAREITMQMGRPIKYSPLEIDGLKERADYMIDIACQALGDIIVEDTKDYLKYIKRVPLGTAFIIAPWNYPYLTSVNAIIPALLAGNAVILKHSQQTPLTAERYNEAFIHAGLPSGVFSYLHLSHDDTMGIIKSDYVDFVSFTGSVAGGKMVENSAAGRFIPTALELGGKDGAYVRKDANLDHAVASIVDGAFFNSGQSCCGIERVYVHHDVFAEFLKKAKEITQNYVIGSPYNMDTTIGPMVNVKAADVVRAQIKNALDAGAIANIDESQFKNISSNRAYVVPQILTNVNHNMAIMREETFGPVMPVMPVADDFEAISLINDSEFGLTSAIFSKDHKEAQNIADKLNTGTVFINRCDYLDPALSWVGVKNSGRGCSLSKFGFDSLTRPKSYHIKTME